MNDDTLLGYQVLNVFAKYFNAYYSFVYTPDQIASTINPSHPEVIVDGLGLMARSTVDSDSGKIDEAMKNLSDNSKGNIPALSSFAYAFSQAAQNTSAWDATKFVTIGTVKELGNGAAAVGNAVISSGKLVLWLLPIGAVAFIYFYGKNTLKRVS